MGLVGTNLVKALKEKGHTVYGLDLENGYDLRDEKLVDKVIGEIKPEFVYHLAAYAAEAMGQVSPVDMTQRNIGIFVNVLKASINSGMKKFLYTSSISVYGESDKPYDEEDVCNPTDIYGVNKLACEQILKILAKVHKFEYVIFRPHNLYGPGQKMNDPYRNVVALFLRRLIENQSYLLYGEGKMRRAFSYVEDVVDIMVECLNHSGITFNIGTSKDISIKDLSDMLIRLTGEEVPIENKEIRPQEIMMFLADHKIQDKLFNYKETPLEEGMKKTIEWVKSQQLKDLITINKEIV